MIGLQVTTLTPSISRHNGTTIRGREITTHTAAQSRHCSMCAVLGSGRHDPTFMRMQLRVAGKSWRVRATSGVGAIEPGLSLSLRLDLVPCCCVMSYSVLIWSKIVAIPQRCRRSLYRHPLRIAAAAAAAATSAAAAERRLLLCCGCGWCLLRWFPKIQIKSHCSVDVVSCRCCCCCCGAVLTFSCTCFKSVLLSLLRKIDAAVRGFCTHHQVARFSCALCVFVEFLSQTQLNACRSECGLFLTLMDE